MLERTGGGSNIVGGAGGGRLRLARAGEAEGGRRLAPESGTGSEKGRREFLLGETSEGEYGGGREDQVWTDPDNETGRDCTAVVEPTCGD
jgi:hypothetical protein